MENKEALHYLRLLEEQLSVVLGNLQIVGNARTLPRLSEQAQRHLATATNAARTALDVQCKKLRRCIEPAQSEEEDHVS